MWTVRTMAFALACGAIACNSDPTLTVDVTNPTDLAIESTSISVYESEEVACDGVVFGDLDDAQLATLLVAQESIDSTGKVSGDLSGLSRTDNKVIVARAFGSDGSFVAAGCVEKGLVTGDDSVSIATEATVDVSLGLPSPAGADPLAVQIAVTDPTGASVDGRQVSWTVFGAAGTMPYEDASSFLSLGDGEWRPENPSCTSSGAVKMHPMPPDLIGGYAVQMRVEWARVPAPQFTNLSALDLSAVTGLSLPANFSQRYCASHITGGSHRIACVDTQLGSFVVRDFSVSVTAGAAHLQSEQNEPLPGGAVALYSLDAGSGDRDVYAIDATGNVTGLFGATGGSPSGVAGVDDVMVVPACGSDAARLLVHTPAGSGLGVQLDGLVELDARGGNPQTLTIDTPDKNTAPNAELVSAGCVSELNPGADADLKQVFVIDVGVGTKKTFFTAETHAAYDCTAGKTPTCTDIALFAGAGVGFTPGTEPHMITTTVDATGVLLAQVVMAPAKSNGATAAADHLVERSHVSAASIPDDIVTGQFDADGQADTLWDLATKRGAGTSFEIAYARIVGADPLEAISGLQDVTVDGVIADDVTGDGLDDVIVTGTLAATSLTGVIVVPMGAAPPTITVGSDAPCP